MLFHVVVNRATAEGHFRAGSSLTAKSCLPDNSENILVSNLSEDYDCVCRIKVGLGFSRHANSLSYTEERLGIIRCERSYGQSEGATVFDKSWREGDSVEHLSVVSLDSCGFRQGDHIVHPLFVRDVRRSGSDLFVNDNYGIHSSGVSSEKTVIAGQPAYELISTSYVERLNATTRLHMRRLTRLTLAFSKKRENFKAAVGLHFAYYNFVRPHHTLRCTPAMAAGVSPTFWSVGDLVEAAA